MLLFAALASRLGGDDAGGAFRALFDAHAASAARLLRRLGVGQSELDDVLQEVFLVVHRRHHDVDDGAHRPWIHGICARKASEHRRSARRRRDAPVASEATPDDVPDMSAGGRDPERRATESQALARLDRALETLPDEERAAFVLYEIEELTLKEIAEATSSPVSTVHARLDRARDRVSRAFSRPASRRSA